MLLPRLEPVKRCKCFKSDPGMVKQPRLWVLRFGARLWCFWVSWHWMDLLQLSFPAQRPSGQAMQCIAALHVLLWRILDNFTHYANTNYNELHIDAKWQNLCGSESFEGDNGMTSELRTIKHSESDAKCQETKHSCLFARWLDCCQTFLLQSPEIMKFWPGTKHSFTNNCVKWSMWGRSSSCGSCTLCSIKIGSWPAYSIPFSDTEKALGICFLVMR